MTQLKDVLHLYPGCEVENYPYGKEKINPLVGVLIGVVGEKVYIQNKDVKGNKWDHLTTDYITEIKPILNHLTDMPDEHLECLRSERGLMRGIHRLDLKYVIRQNEWSPEDVVFLLSKHFDLFRLIESGQAIDRKTLKK